MEEKLIFMKILEKYLKWLKGKSLEESLHNISISLIVIAAFFVVIGIGVGTYVPGFPVALAILGSFLVMLGIVMYAAGEILKILRKTH